MSTVNPRHRTRFTQPRSRSRSSSSIKVGTRGRCPFCNDGTETVARNPDQTSSTASLWSCEAYGIRHGLLIGVNPKRRAGRFVNDFKGRTPQPYDRDEYLYRSYEQRNKVDAQRAAFRFSRPVERAIEAAIGRQLGSALTREVLSRLRAVAADYVASPYTQSSKTVQRKRRLATNQSVRAIERLSTKLADDLVTLLEEKMSPSNEAIMVGGLYYYGIPPGDIVRHLRCVALAAQAFIPLNTVKRGGRADPARAQLHTSVGRVIESVGLQVTSSPGGIFANVLRQVYDGMRVKPPTDLGRILRHTMKIMRSGKSEDIGTDLVGSMMTASAILG